MAKKFAFNQVFSNSAAVKCNKRSLTIFDCVKSSGYKFLDQAAIRIVRLAAPFERFPDRIRADTDILHITRTWTFTKSDQVVAE